MNCSLAPAGKDQGMDDELCTAMLTAVFAAVIIVLGLGFVDQRKREEAALLLRNIAMPQARAVPRHIRPEGFPRRVHGLQRRERAHSTHERQASPRERQASRRPHLL
jgi:hypothetical protein